MGTQFYYQLSEVRFESNGLIFIRRLAHDSDSPVPRVIETVIDAETGAPMSR